MKNEIETLAMKYYVGETINELQEDLEILDLINKQFGKYKKTGNINVHLTLNHIITLYNQFNVGATQMLFLRIKEDRWSGLCTFLAFLKYLPEYVFVNNRYVYTENIMLDDYILNDLRAI